MALDPGTRLGRYEIRSRLGAGGMGEVYLAEDTKLDRKIALKILPTDVASNKDRMARSAVCQPAPVYKSDLRNRRGYTQLDSDGRAWR
jgi:serine/threonine protein kinase